MNGKTFTFCEVKGLGVKAITTGSHAHAHTDSHLSGKSWNKAGSTLTQGRVKNLSPHFIVAAVIYIKYCQEKVLS